MYSIPCIPNNKLKAEIVGILSREWPMSAKEVYNAVPASHGTRYGSVYKALRELVSSGILSKDARRYMLDFSWVEQLLVFSMRTKVIYDMHAYAEKKTAFN